MKAENGDQQKQIVVVAADVGNYSVTTVRLALQLAASINSRLRGLFVEDEDLLQVSGLPCTREITLTTARERPTSVDQMQRSLRSAAEQFRRSLEREAQALQIAWSFDTVRGRVGDIGQHSAGSATFTVFDRAQPYRLASRTSTAPRRILLVPNRSRHELQALHIVLERFAGEKIDLTLVVRADDPAFRDEIDGLVAERSPEVRIHELKAEALPGLLERAGTGYDCAIMSRHEPAELQATLLSQLRCPIVLVA